MVIKIIQIVLYKMCNTICIIKKEEVILCKLIEV
jgi:hypothetical protein